MPVRNCCLGCQGPMAGPCGSLAARQECCGNDVGPCCCHSFSWCCSPCSEKTPGVLHGARGGVASSYYSCGHGCIGGCTSGLCACCCGPACS